MSFSARRLVPLLPLVLVAACAENERSVFDPASDRQPPELTSVAVVAEDGAAWVDWEASEPVRVVVEYGDAANALHRHSYAGIRQFLSSGRVRLLGADPNREYAYSIRMVDRAGNEVSATRDEVPTLDTSDLDDGRLFFLAMIDVGWGDALYLEVPDSGSAKGFNSVLIDAGHPHDGPVVRRFLERRGIFELDFASLSHVHEDHIGGFYGDDFNDLNGLIQINGTSEARFPIGTFLDVQDKTTTNGPYGNLGSALGAMGAFLGEHAFLRWGASGADTDALDWGDAKVDLLAAGRKDYILPDFALQENNGSVVNNDSMVYRVQYGNFVVLLTGDAEFATEQFLQNRFARPFLRAHLLKLGHHGSNDANSERWVDFVDPIVGFIPNAVSENPGVEHPYVLRRLRNRGIDYYASDRVIPNRDRALPGVRGDLLVWTDGEDFTIVAENVRYE